MKPANLKLLNLLWFACVSWLSAFDMQVLSCPPTPSSSHSLCATYLQNLCEPRRFHSESLDYQSKSLIANDQRKNDLAQRHRETESRLRRSRLLPDEAALAKIGRYEAHLAKQLSQALHELERVQERRRGGFVASPMVLDVNITGTESDLG